nr:N-acetylmuramoyl-L-alanine amidase [uncultured Acetatifactor sp.]
MYRFFITVITVVVTGLLISVQACAAPRLQDTGGKVIIVIDPGHGGKNQGTIENNHEEKQMTLTTALAMYEELSLYDNVEIYMTRTEDVDLSLKERAEFALSVDADFLFSIHYNASLNHELFGSEVWVPLEAPYNTYGYQFGHEFLSAMKEKGLFVRGIKTRLGEDGLDYYGIIRESVEREIPAVIMEHCHVDEPRDASFCDSEEKLREFGRADAEAVAKYFGLKSSALNVDYSDYQLTEADAAFSRTKVDSTEPDLCLLDFLEADYENGTLSLAVSAADYDSPLLYYSCSTDGGKTYSARECWPECDTLTGDYPDTFTLNLDIQPGTAPKVIVRAYNQYDLYTESNCYISPQVFPSQQEEASADQNPDSGDGESVEVVPVGADINVQNTGEDADRDVSFLVFLEICLVFAALLLVLVIVSQCIVRRNRKKKRLQRRKEAGDTRNQKR